MQNRSVGCIHLAHKGCSLYKSQIGRRQGLAGAAAAAINILVMNSGHRPQQGISSYSSSPLHSPPLPQFLKASMLNRYGRINEAAN